MWQPFKTTTVNVLQWIDSGWVKVLEKKYIIIDTEPKIILTQPSFQFYFQDLLLDTVLTKISREKLLQNYDRDNFQFTTADTLPYLIANMQFRIPKSAQDNSGISKFTVANKKLLADLKPGTRLEFIFNMQSAFPETGELIFNRNYKRIIEVAD